MLSFFQKLPLVASKLSITTFITKTIAPTINYMPIRGSKYKTFHGRALKNLTLPKQRHKGSMLKNMLTRKYYRLKIGTTDQRPGKPGYGVKDVILSKMNI